MGSAPRYVAVDEYVFPGCVLRSPRHQVHRLEDGTLSVFSRNSEDMSAKYPDLFEQLPKVRPPRVGVPHHVESARLRLLRKARRLSYLIVRLSHLTASP